MLKGTLCIVSNWIICKSETWAHFPQDGGHMSCSKQIVAGNIPRQLLKSIKVFILRLYECVIQLRANYIFHETHE